jgi:hypothetical protein
MAGKTKRIGGTFEVRDMSSMVKPPWIIRRRIEPVDCVCSRQECKACSEGWSDCGSDEKGASRRDVFKEMVVIWDDGNNEESCVATRKLSDI